MRLNFEFFFVGTTHYIGTYNQFACKICFRFISYTIV